MSLQEYMQAPWSLQEKLVSCIHWIARLLSRLSRPEVPLPWTLKCSPEKSSQQIALPDLNLQMVMYELKTGLDAKSSHHAQSPMTKAAIQVP